MAIRDVRTINMINGSISPNRPNQHETDPDKTTSRNSISSPSGKTPAIENVLILQGGGSLGAFGCGVFKALSQKGVKIDIVAGTSIGEVNAAYHSWKQRWEPTRTITRAILARARRQFCRFGKRRSFLIPVHGKANGKLPLFLSIWIARSQK